MVGAVGIENNTDWNFKDFEEMARSAKALKRNDKESNGILIGPSMAPRFFRADQIPSWCVFRPLPQIQSRLRAQISRRGWQADDRTFFERRTSIRMTAARTIHNLHLPTTYGSGDQGRSAILLIRLAQSCARTALFSMVFGGFRTLIRLNLVLHIASTPGAKAPPSLHCNPLSVNR